MNTAKGLQRIVLLITLFLTSILYGQVRYKIVMLEPQTGGATFYPTAINNNGEIVGYVRGAGNVSRAILFDTTGRGRSADLGTLPGDLYSRAYSINNGGKIVGSSIDNRGTPHATLFDISGRGNNIDLRTLGGTLSVAISINDNGMIVGYAADNLGAERATLFDETGRGYNRDLGTLPGCENSYATSANATGQIVGYCVDNSGQFYAAIFDFQGGQNINLGTLSGLLSTPNRINNHGQIVGVSSLSRRTQHAVLFKLPGGSEKSTDLGSLPVRFGSSEALSINNNGEIVGYGLNDRDEARAVLFDASGMGNNIDLNTLIDPASGWVLNYAYAINDNGVIVGVGTRGAFMLVPDTLYTTGSLPPERY